MISRAKKKDFATLVDAIQAGQVALMECVRKSDKKKVAVVCAVNGGTSDTEGALLQMMGAPVETEFVPFAVLLSPGDIKDLQTPESSDGTIIDANCEPMRLRKKCTSKTATK